MLGLRCCAGFSLVAAIGGRGEGAQKRCSLSQVYRLLIHWLLLLLSTGSRLPGFRSCGTWAPGLSSGLVAPHGVWELPRPGMEPVASALASGFSTPGPPGKSLPSCFCRWRKELQAKECRWLVEAARGKKADSSLASSDRNTALQHLDCGPVRPMRHF